MNYKVPVILVLSIGIIGCLVYVSNPRGGFRLRPSDAAVPPKASAFSLKSPVFDPGGAIPQAYACDGKSLAPPLAIEGVPANAQSLALTLHDPDAPRPGGFDHWLVYDMPSSTTSLPEGVRPPGKEGMNGAGTPGYIGLCPPTGSHRYEFTLYALDTMLDLPPNYPLAQFQAKMEGHVIGQARLVGTYQKH